MMEMKISCIIVDDEPLAVEKIKGFIEKVDYLELKATFHSGMDALFYLRKNSVDLLFLDVQMDELDGMQLLQILPSKPYVIMTTAYNQYAIDSYELNVSDYLLKPIGFQRFTQAAERVKHKINIEKDAETVNSESIENAHFFVRSDYQLIKISLDEIRYLEAEKEYVIIHCASRKIKTRKKLKTFEEYLPSPPFFRIHKSFVISFQYLDSVSSHEVEINGKKLPLGDFYKNDLIQYMELI